MTAKQAELAAQFGVQVPYPEDVTLPPPELFSKRLGWVVRQDSSQRVLDVMHWGVPLKMKRAKGQPITSR